MDKKVPVTRDGLDRLRIELEELKTVKRPQITAQVAEARSHGDLRENAGYEAARHDQMMNERRIADLETLLRSAVIVDDKAASNDVVSVGSTVVVDWNGEEERYTIVGAIEAKASAGRISNESPMGRALLGKKVGDKATVPSPVGDQQITIKSIE